MFIIIITPSKILYVLCDIKFVRCVMSYAPIPCNFRVKQGEADVVRASEILYEMSKPLARSADDADLDAHLREQEREGDPMLAFIKKKKEKKSKAPSK